MGAGSQFRATRRISLPTLLVGCCALTPNFAPAASDGPDSRGASAEQTTEAAQPQSDPSDQLAEVVVTAQKRRQDIKDIPISISAIGGDQIAAQHIQGFEDLSRAVPNVSFAEGSGNGVGVGMTFVEIRGVSSTSGSATTGLYLDDTSISVNQNSAVGAVQPLPVDLERIEVLRGPQGTLYGASSEGGTVRFIENQAKLDVVEGSVSADLSGTENGGLNYMAMGVVNVPVLPGVLGLRGNIAYGDDSGWIDNYSQSAVLQRRNVNSVRHELLRLNAVAQASDDLAITANLFWQRNQQSDAPVFEIQDQAFAAANSIIIPPPVASDGLYRQHFTTIQSAQDTLAVPSLTLHYTPDYGDFTSVTSDLYRRLDRVSDGQDYTSFYISNLINAVTPNPMNGEIGLLPSPQIQPALFRNFSQELRYASREFHLLGMASHGVAGLYYSDYREEDRNTNPVPGIGALFQSIYGYGINSAQSPVGNPVYPNFWANDWADFWASQQQTKQYSAFGQLDFDIVPALHGAIGLRYLYATVDSHVYSQPHLANTLLPNGQTDIYSTQRSHAVTPKFSLTYDLSANANVYTTIAKGYRLGGADTEPPPTNPGSVCQPDYTLLGIKAPTSGFGPDSVWSYELGSKARLLGNTLSLDAAGYDIEWKNIQQAFYLPTCGFPYALNVGNARSYGAELQLNYKPAFVRGLTVGLNGNYSHATIVSSLQPTVVAVGENVLFVPVYSATISGEYRRPITADMTGFIRADYDMTGHSYGSYITSNPGYYNNAYAVLNASFGISTENNLEVAMYAKNLADNRTLIQTPALNLQVTGYTVRPLTAGVTVLKKF